MKRGEERRSPGRPREFDYAKALRAAMLVFWRFGYEGASLDELTAAMGVSRPTLYAAFGDKRNLLREAVRAYIGLHAEEYKAALELSTAREVIETWLRLTGGIRPEEDVPPGCLLIQGALVGGPEEDFVQKELAAIRIEGTRQLVKRFERAEQEGDLPGHWRPEPLAQYLSALATGFAVQSSSGATPQELNGIIDHIMKDWPK